MKRNSPAAPRGAPSPERTTHPSTVRIDTHLGGAREVYLAGTFNDWSPTSLPMVNLGGGRWGKDLVLDPGRHEYLLVADGRWLSDPQNPNSCPNPFGGLNSVLLVP